MAGLSLVAGAPLHQHARRIVLLILIAIVAGIVLRLSGFVGGAYSWFLHSGAGDDSWMPMRLAYARVLGESPGTLRDLFLVDHVKFQYPPSSLLLYFGLDLMGITPTDRVMNELVWLSILITPLLMFAICIKYMATHRLVTGFSRKDEFVIAAMFMIATLFFYPIMISWRLGQVQGILNMLFAAACLSWLMERKALTGVLIGVMCLLKPQFSLFIVWGVLRRQYSFAAGQIVTVGIGALLSIMLCGWQAHLDYLEVLKFISQRGEIFWDNTSVNGLVNRLFHPDQTLIFEYHDWPPYNRTVHLATLTGFLIINAIALFGVGRSTGRGNVLDFMTAAFCFTLAAPQAWGHHFGIALPMFAILLIALGFYPERRQGSRFLVAGACFLAFSVNWNVTDLLAGTSFTILQSWRLLAAFVVLWLLYRVTNAPRASEQSAIPVADGLSGWLASMTNCMSVLKRPTR